MRLVTSMRLFRLSLCALVLAAAALSASAVERPFKLSGTTLLTPTADGEFSMKGVGTASHVGNWTNTGTFFLYPDFHGTGEIDLVAANGDHLYFIADGVADPLTGKVVASYTVEGGTG